MAENGTVIGLGNVIKDGVRRRFGKKAIEHAKLACKAMSDGGSIEEARSHARKMAFCASKAFADTETEVPAEPMSEDVSEVYRSFGNEPPAVPAPAISEPTDEELAAEEAKLAESDKDVISPVVDDMIEQLRAVVKSGDIDDKKRKEIEGLLERIETEAPSLKAAIDQAKEMLDAIKPPAPGEDSAAVA